MDKNTSKMTFASYKERDRSEKVEKGFVKYGKDNDYPNYLNDLYLSSSTHHALCDSIAYSIAGKDIEGDVSAKLKIANLHLNDLKGLLAFDLKVQGWYAFEGIRNKKGEVISYEHLPAMNLRPQEEDEEGVVRNYFYCEDWKDTRKKNTALENPIPVLDDSNKQPKFLVVVKPPATEDSYFAKPDYIGSLNYIELEKEIGVFHLNNIKNGFFPSAFIVWKDGIPTSEERREHMADMEADLGGAQNAGKFVNIYASSEETAPTVTSFDTNDADKMYDFLSEETTSKIMIGHRVVTPALFGVKTAGQLGSTQELETGSILFESTVIEPFREILIKGLEIALRECGVSSEIEIPSNNRFMPQEEASVDQSFTGIQISSAVDIITKVKTGELTKAQGIQVLVSMLSFTREAAENMFKDQFSSTHPLDLFHSELDDDLDGYVLVDEEEVGEESSDFDFEGILNSEAEKFASTGTARPNANSEQDVTHNGQKFKVRYYYAGSESPEREFCVKMKQANKLYRKEDIVRMGSMAVNPGWGPKGADTYDIWLYKGGGNCYHKWFRKIFVVEGANVDVNSPNATVISTTKARSQGVPIETNDNLVSIAPIDMPKRGFLNSVRELFNQIFR